MIEAGLDAPLEVASPAAAPPVALYVHIPFCVSLCPYCDFVVNAGAAARGPTARIDAFLPALEAELELRADALDKRFGLGRPPLETIYLGGGTPSLLPADSVAGLLARIGERFGLDDDAEITLEANPGADERGNARAWRAAGITRLSLGAQSFDDDELRRLGRRHRAIDVLAAVGEVRDAGIASVSLDLLYDVPGSTEASWARSLDTAMALGPDHLSLYALTLDDPDAEGLTGPLGDHLPTTAGARRWRARARPDQDDDRAAAQYLHATTALASAGWRGYEISNWARPGYESRHNLVYWQRRPYEAIGPGAHAFDGRTRRWNAARLDTYVAALSPERGSASLPPGGEEIIDQRAAAVEATILALRTDRGVPLAATTRRSVAATFAWAAANELTQVTVDERVVFTTRGRLMSNEVFVRLL